MVFHHINSSGTFDSWLYDKVVIGAGESFDAVGTYADSGNRYDANYAQPTIDGILDECWHKNGYHDINIPAIGDGSAESEARSRVMHDDTKVYFYAEIIDATPSDGDALELYFDEDNCGGVGDNLAYCDLSTQLRFYLNGTYEAGANSKGTADMVTDYAVTEADGVYYLEIAVDLLEAIPDGKTIGFEMMYADCNADGEMLEAYFWNANPKEGAILPYLSPRFFGTLCFREIKDLGTVAYVPENGITVDGTKDAAYADVTPIAVNYIDGVSVTTSDDASSYADVYMMTNNGLLYVFADINDDDIVTPTEDAQNNAPWETESLELFINPTGNGEGDIYQFRVDVSGYPSFYKNQSGDIAAYGPEAAAPYFVSYAAGEREGGYTLEFCIDLKNFEVTDDSQIGFNLQLNDRHSDGGQTFCHNSSASSFESWFYNKLTIDMSDLTADMPRVTISDANGLAGGTVIVPVVITNNTGIVSMTLDLTFDESIFTLTEVRDTGLLSGQMHTTKYTSPYRLTWENDASAKENITVNGTIAELVFTIAEDAPVGTYVFDVETVKDGIYDINLDNVDFVMDDGVVSVVDYQIGDVNGDGEVTNRDRAQLSRVLADWDGYELESLIFAAADINGDGEITNRDRAILSRHLADWDGYETLSDFRED